MPKRTLTLGKRLAIVVLCLAGCRPSPNATPGAAFLFVSADEPAVQGLEFRLRSPDWDAVPVLRVKPGEKIVAQHASLAGTYTLEVQPPGCSLAVALSAGSEIDVDFNEASSDCLELNGVHEAGAPPHPYFGTLSLAITGARPWQQVTVDLVSVDQPPNPGGGLLTPDEAGRFYQDDLPPGNYEVRIGEAGEVLVWEPFTIGSGADASVDLVVEVPERN